MNNKQKISSSSTGTGGAIMKKKCKLCDYTWEARIDNPRTCPSCKRHDWNKDKEKTNENSN